MKIIFNRLCEHFLNHCYSSSYSIVLLALALCLLSCKDDDETLSPLRGSDKTVINTRPAAFVATDSAKLSAEILETGPAPILEAGFILSQNPDLNLETGTILKIQEFNKTGPYSIVAKKLDANKKYYYRFYIKNKDQVLLGSIQAFTTSGIAISRVRYINVTEPDDFYEGSAGNYMMIEGTNFSKIPSENKVKIGDIAVSVSSVSVYNEQEGSTVLFFYLPYNIVPGQHEVSVTRAGQTVKAPETLQVLPGQWKQLQDLTTGFESNGPTYSADAFAMNGKGYMAGMLPYLPVSLYQYSPGADSWSKLSISISTYHYFQAAFGLNGKIYISAGANSYNTDKSLSRYELQLHSLDPATGVQEQKQSTPLFYPQNNVNTNVTSFTIGNYAYLGGGDYPIDSWGNREVRKDFYKYSPATDTWTRIADFPGTSTTDAVTFEVNGIAYLIAATQNYKVLPEVWAYNPNTDTWSRKGDFPGQLKYFMEGFSIGSSGYVIGGDVNRSIYSYVGPNKRDFWKYDPATDRWQEVASFDNSGKGIKCFVVGGKAYAVLHQWQNRSLVWEFTPAP